jgi:hypothetical protein
VSKYLSKARKIVEVVNLLDGAPANLCKPTAGDRLEVIEKARAAGDISSESGEDQPKDARAAMRFAARMVSVCLYDPETSARCFGDAELEELPNQMWFEDILPKCTAVFNAEGTRGK